MGVSGWVGLYADPVERKRIIMQKRKANCRCQASEGRGEPFSSAEEELAADNVSLFSPR